MGPYVAWFSNVEPASNSRSGLPRREVWSQRPRSLPELSQCRGRSSWGGWTGRTLPWRTGQRLSMCPPDHLSGEPASTVSTATPAGGKRNPASVGGRRSPSLGSLRQGKELSSEAMPGAPARQKFNKYSRQSLLPQPQFRFPQF